MARKRNPLLDPDDARYRTARWALAAEVQAEAAETQFWTGRERFADAVIDAIGTVPRHAFLPGPLSPELAYANRPQQIGHGQTISQPYIVALMTDLLNLEGAETVLEIGTGSGYQTAVLAELSGQVFTLERVEELAAWAALCLDAQGYDNIHARSGGELRGWDEEAPFDRIIVTAAAEGEIPPALIEQLAPGGRMVIPVGPRYGPQQLMLGLKDDHGRFHADPVLPVAFVPLVPERKE